MSILDHLAPLAAAGLLLSGAHARALTEQTAQHVFQGRSFLYLEAEDFASRGADPDDNGWKVVSKEAPTTSTGGLDILPSDSNVSGSALLDEIGGTAHSDTAVYEVTFVTAGVYQLYTRHTMFDSNGNGNYANEDSFYVSPAFDRDSEGDWVGFQGLEFDVNDPNVDIPNPGFALDPDGFKPSIGDSSNDGWYAIRDWGIKSQGAVIFPNDARGDDWNGNFHWYNRPALIASGQTGSFVSDFGFKTEYTVTAQQVGQVLTFEIGTREAYGVFDGFLFIQDDGVDLLDQFTQAEVDAVLVVPEASSVAMLLGALGAVHFCRRMAR